MSVPNFDPAEFERWLEGKTPLNYITLCCAEAMEHNDRSRFPTCNEIADGLEMPYANCLAELKALETGGTIRKADPSIRKNARWIVAAPVHTDTDGRVPDGYIASSSPQENTNVTEVDHELLEEDYE